MMISVPVGLNQSQRIKPGRRNLIEWTERFSHVTTAHCCFHCVNASWPCSGWHPCLLFVTSPTRITASELHTIYLLKTPANRIWTLSKEEKKIHKSISQDWSKYKTKIPLRSDCASKSLLCVYCVQRGATQQAGQDGRPGDALQSSGEARHSRHAASTRGQGGDQIRDATRWARHCSTEEYQGHKKRKKCFVFVFKFLHFVIKVEVSGSKWKFKSHD